MAVDRAAISSLEGPIAHPSGRSARPITKTPLLRIIVAYLSLDCRRIECGTVGIARKEHGQRDGRIRSVKKLRKALLAEAVVEPPLKGAQLALRHPIRGPRGVCLLCAFELGQIRQILQPYTLAVFAMASDAPEIVRSATEVEHPFADAIRRRFLWMRKRDVHR